jgi:mannose-6-phosphate isomerase-like protein (cupin superfamily)
LRPIAVARILPPTMPDAVNLAQKLSLFSDHWAPRIVAALNDYDVKVVKVKGEFVWHDHHDTDELFLVLRGHLRIELRDGAVDLAPGELYVVPRGVQHRPVAAEECEILLVEPRGVVNTGEAGGPLTNEARPL